MLISIYQDNEFQEQSVKYIYEFLYKFKRYQIVWYSFVKASKYLDTEFDIRCSP